MMDGTWLALGAAGGLTVAHALLERRGSAVQFGPAPPVELARAALIDGWYSQIEYVGLALGPRGHVQVFEATNQEGRRCRINVGRVVGDRLEVLSKQLRGGKRG